ncbi:MAG: ATP-binding protein [Bacteroidia bacterium]|jgi:serine/threonine-protein kinase RsbW|nr:ATP-binding protein [Bacteroidia bacterium]
MDCKNLELFETKLHKISIKGHFKLKMFKKLDIKSKLSNLGIVENMIDTITQDAGINKDNYGKILVSTMEAVNNAIIHGNKSDENKSVYIEFLLKNNIVQITITDQGNGFKPDKVPDPTKPENIEAINGRGVFLMKKLADEIEFNEKGNSVKMTFKNIIS